MNPELKNIKLRRKLRDAHPQLKPEGVKVESSVDQDFIKKLMEDSYSMLQFEFNSIPYTFMRPAVKLVDIEKIIFNDPATILILKDGRKIVSKAHSEEFDKEKGLLMCLCKANGITHLQLKKLIDGAVDQKPKPEPKASVEEAINNIADTVRRAVNYVNGLSQEELEKFWRGE